MRGLSVWLGGAVMATSRMLPSLSHLIRCTKFQVSIRRRVTVELKLNPKAVRKCVKKAGKLSGESSGAS